MEIGLHLHSTNMFASLLWENIMPDTGDLGSEQKFCPCPQGSLVQQGDSTLEKLLTMCQLRAPTGPQKRLHRGDVLHLPLAQ